MKKRLLKRSLRPIFLFLSLTISLTLYSQQDPMFSQYMFNRLVINPAYAGSRDQLSAVLVARQQWLGFEGAPSTQSIGLHAPSGDNRHGFGLVVINDRAGFTSNALATFNYAYRIPIGESHLAFGLNAGMNSYWTRLSEVDTWDQGDVAFGNGGDFSRLLFVAGPGLYFHNEHFYLGASVPNVIPHKLYDSYYEQLFAEKARHLYAMAGLVLDLGSALKFKPSAMLRASTGAPLAMDLNASFLLKERIWLGASWRPGNAAIFVAEIFLTRGIRLGYSYDYPLNEVREYTSGSHELMLGFDFQFSKGKMESPKLF